MAPNIHKIFEKTQKYFLWFSTHPYHLGQVNASMLKRGRKNYQIPLKSIAVLNFAINAKMNHLKILQNF